MKKIEIPIYFAKTEPEGYTPFSIVFGSTWRAYEAGELNPEKILLINVLYRRVNPYSGIGHTSYSEICVLLKEKPTANNESQINKLMVDLRDENHLIWFPEHKGRREFPYVIADFKLALKPNEVGQKWIDVKPYFHSPEQKHGRAEPQPAITTKPEAPPRLNHTEQRLEKSNSEGFISAGEALEGRFGRPPQTNTDKQT